MQAIIELDRIKFIRLISDQKNDLFSGLDYSLIRDFEQDGTTVQNFNKNTSESRIYNLIRLIQEFPEIWAKLDETDRHFIEHANKNMFSSYDPTITRYQGAGHETDSRKIQTRYLCISSYLFVSEDQNYASYIASLEKIRENYIPTGNFIDFSIYNFISEEDFYLMLNQAKYYRGEQMFFEFFIKHLGGSLQYSQARFNFNLICEHLHDLSKSNQKKLIEQINLNNQIYNLNEIQEIIQKISRAFGLTTLGDWKALCENLGNIEDKIKNYFINDDFSNIL